ncbi:MAG: mannosyltransferase family protein [Actinomycetota bacterium]
MTITSPFRRLHLPPSSDPWGKTLRRAGVVYLMSRLFVVMGAAIAVAAQAVTDRTNDIVPANGLKGLAAILDSWDGHWYLDVVREGYPHHIMPNVTYFVSDARAAFFPLYPRLVHYLDILIPGGPVSVALAINIVLGALFVFLAGYLCRDLFDIKTAEKAMILIALFPGSFVLSMAYSEALMLTIVALCFIALRDKHWVWAGVLAAMATATRPNGIALVAACAVASYLAIRNNREWRSLLAPVLSPLGFLGFMWFLRMHTGENMAWFRVQREAWQEGTSFGATAVQRTYDFFVHPVSSPTSVLTAASVAAMVISLYLARKYKMNLIYWSYTAVVLALMLIPATVTARPRFLFTAFPLFFPVARALRDEDETWWPIVVMVMIGGLVTVTGIYGVHGAIP